MAAPLLKMRRLRVSNFERVSTDRQETERQRFDLADNVEEYSLDVVDTVRVKISGTKVNTVADWKEMLERLKSPDRDGINISALDRLFRPEDFAIIGEALQVFRDYKKVIVSTKERLIEPWTPRGWQTCMESVLQAGKELAELKRRTAGGRRKAHANNKPMNTTAPFGLLYRDRYSKDADGKCQYFYEDATPASNGQTRREVVEMIFDWRDAGMKTYRICKRLNELGILTGGLRKKDGSWQYEPGLWTRSTVIQLLKNRHYIGEHWEGGKRVDVACPAFISRELFERVEQSFVKEKSDADKSGRPSGVALLHEYLYCDLCKHRLYFHRAKRDVYRCMHLTKDYKRGCTLSQVRADIVEPMTFAAVWNHITDAELLLANAKAYYDSLPTRPAAATLEAELADVTARMERTKRMVRLGTMDEDEGNAEILADQKRAAELRAELRTAGGVAELPAKQRVEAACRRIAEGKMPSEFATQRPVLEKLLDLKCWFDGDEVTITGRVPVPAERGLKCSGRVNGGHTSTLFIPFKIKATIPAAPKYKTTRAAALKIWEKRRENGTTASLTGEAMRAAAVKGWKARRKRERVA